MTRPAHSQESGRVRGPGYRESELTGFHRGRPGMGTLPDSNPPSGADRASFPSRRGPGPLLRFPAAGVPGPRRFESNRGHMAAQHLQCSRDKGPLAQGAEKMSTVRGKPGLARVAAGGLVLRQRKRHSGGRMLPLRRGFDSRTEQCSVRRRRATSPQAKRIAAKQGRRGFAVGHAKQTPWLVAWGSMAGDYAQAVKLGWQRRRPVSRIFEIGFETVCGGGVAR